MGLSVTHSGAQGPMSNAHHFLSGLLVDRHWIPIVGDREYPPIVAGAHGCDLDCVGEATLDLTTGGNKIEYCR